jgi:hypothetical protein
MTVPTRARGRAAGLGQLIAPAVSRTPGHENPPAIETTR